MLQHRTFRSPPGNPVRYGSRIPNRAGTETPGVSKALLITDNFLFTSGAVSPVIESLKASDIEVDVYSGVNSEPTLLHVEECFALLKKSGNCGALVGCAGAALLM